MRDGREEKRREEESTPCLLRLRRDLYSGRMPEVKRYPTEDPRSEQEQEQEAAAEVVANLRC